MLTELKACDKTQSDEHTLHDSDEGSDDDYAKQNDDGDYDNDNKGSRTVSCGTWSALDE
jgi:hypothetical protein